MHALLAVFEYVPLSHATHEAAPEPDALPATQETQAAALAFDHVPPSHFVHVLLAAPEYVPLTHATHEAAPAFEYVPPTHAEQLGEPAAE